jgi:predicted Zn-dependent peptidase
MKKQEAFAKQYNLDISNVEFREFELDNGLQVILSRSNKIPTVAINTAYHAGSKNEDPLKTGLAHLFEHLMFEGTANTGRGEFDELLTIRGGESNAYTNWDVTSYFLTVPSHQLEFGLWLDSDRMAGFGVDEESLKVQQDVVIEEKMWSCDNTPYGSLEEESSKRLFKSTGYRWPIIGSVEHIRKVTLKDLEKFYSKFYVPNNAVVAVTGDIDYSAAEAAVRKYYEGLVRGENVQRPVFDEQPLKKEIRDDIYDNINLPGKFIFYRFPKAGTRDYYALKILDNILSEGDSSRFYKELVYEKELASEVDTSIYSMEELSLFFISAIAFKNKDLNKVEEGIESILDEIKKGNILESELQKAKNKIETVYNFKRNSIVSLADKLCSYKILYGTADKINTEVFDYLDVTIDDIAAAARKYLDTGKRLVLNYLPKTT